MFVRTGLKVLCVSVVVCGASVAYGQPPFIKNLTGFESPLLVSEEALFQNPLFSGTTVRYDQTNADIEPDGVYGFDPVDEPWNLAQVVDWSSYEGTQMYEISFNWGNPDDTDFDNSLYPNDPDPRDTGTNDIVRCTTLLADNLDRPSVHLGGRIKFRLSVVAYEGDDFNNIADASILMVAGIRETGHDLPQGTTDTAGGDIEWVYPNGAIADGLIPADTNGPLPSPAYPGGLRVHTIDHWPPNFNDNADWQEVVINLGSPEAVRGFANDSVEPNTAGTNGLDATGVGDGANRGSWENLTFTNDPADTGVGAGKFFFIYIDKVVLESDVADPAQPPTILGPVYDTDTQVEVMCDNNATEAELFINDISVGTAAPVLNIATFAPFDANKSLGNLQVNDVLRAKQTVFGNVSGFSPPVVVTTEGTILADDFEVYDTEEDFAAFWKGSIANPVPASAKVQWTMGSAASCDHLLKEANPAGSDAARLYRLLSPHVNGTDAEPLVVTWKFQHHGASGAAGERTKFELAREASDTFSASAAARLPGTTGIVLENGPSSIPLPETLDQYEILLMSDDPRTIGSNGIFVGNTNGFFVGNQGNIALTGVDRVSDEWHEMQIVVTSNYINYFIDGQDANPASSNGVKVTAFPKGVPRPNQSSYNFIIIGQGFSNNGPTMMYDDISITVGTTGIPFGPANPVPSPDVISPLLPGEDMVDVMNIDSNAVEINVYVNGMNPVTSNGPFLDNMATVTVPTLNDGDEVTATQTLDIVARVETESCPSAAVVVGVPAVTVEDPLVPTQMTVEVSDVEDAATAVKVYRVIDAVTKQLLGTFTPDPPNPVTVDVSANPLQNGWEIVATQVIGVEGPDSASVIVGVPAPTLPGPVAPGDNFVTVTSVHPLASAVTVYVDGNSNGTANTSGVTQVDVPLGVALADAQVVTATQTIGGVEGPPSGALIVAAGYCKIVFQSGMESGDDWTVNTTADVFYQFGWDVSSLGLPPSPNDDESGNTLGLQMKANMSSGVVPQFVVATPTGVTMTGRFQVRFDFWINANGPFPDGGNGSTEFIGGGVGYDGTTAERNGASLGVTGEGGGARDYRMYKGTGEQFIASTQYDIDSNNVWPIIPPGSADLAAKFPGVQPPLFQQNNYAQQTGTTIPGSGGFAWHTMVITVDTDAGGAGIGTANFSIDGLSIGTLDATIGSTVTTIGNVQVYYFDIFASISDNADLSFGVIDNFVVAEEFGEAEQGANGDWDGSTVVDLTDFVAFEDCFSGPNTSPQPITGLGCRDACLSVFDSDSDNDVDLEDFANFQDQF